MNTDNQLLERYARDGDEPAFRELVERRIRLVHSAALRESQGESALAEDISQAVFAELARRANSLVRHPALAGWLYTCVRRMAANLRRAENRRQRREQEAFAMNDLSNADPNDKLWQELRPVIDDVLHELGETDRTAIVLRFFEGQSLKEVGGALGLSENAARMRVDRSLEKLRSLLERRGVKSTAAALAGVLVLGSVSNASAALTSSVASGALSSAAAKGPVTVSLAKLAVIGGAAVLLVSSAVVWQQVASHRAAPSQTTTAAPQPVVAATTTATADNQSAATTTNSQSAGRMLLHIVEPETGMPLAGAKLLLAYFRENGSSKGVRTNADAAGNVLVDEALPPFRDLNLFATAAGHVPKVISWQSARVLPDGYTLPMPRGMTVAGMVQDEAGRPVAGAKIEFDTPEGNDMSQQENIQFGPDTAARSDTNGHWACDMVPKDLTKLMLTVTRSNYAETHADFDPSGPDATNFVITLPAGFAVSGAVTDGNGLAIRGAEVHEVRMNAEGEKSRKSDSLGNFTFNSMKAGDLMLVAQAKGYAPAVKSIHVSSNVESVLFQLGPGNLLRGHVVDENGHPIRHVHAGTEFDPMAFKKIRWSAEADAGGQFEWDSAPLGPIYYTFSAEGYAPAWRISLAADGSDHEIQLTNLQSGQAKLEVNGTVIDAENGQPLDGFSVLRHRIDPHWVMPFEFFMAGKTGQFSYSGPPGGLAEDSQSYQLQVQKDGYVPAVSGRLKVKDGNQTLVFKLQKGSGPAGSVLLPNGQPATNATVYLCTSQSGVTIDGPVHVRKGLNTTSYTARTDDSGNFTLPPAALPVGIIVMHDQGFAQLSMAAFSTATNITLQPWGRVEGSIVLDGEPATNENVIVEHQTLNYDDAGSPSGFLTFDFGTNTDSSGHFVFPKVPLGQCLVFRTFQSRHRHRSNVQQVTVSPGGVTSVLLGGSGNDVVGSAVLPGASNSIDWSAVSVGLTTTPEPGPAPRIDSFASVAAYIEADKQWHEAWDSLQYFSAACGTNGSFRLPNIPPGNYRLKITVVDSADNSTAPSLPTGPPVIATLVSNITMGDDLLDLGTLALAATNTAAAP